MSAFQSLWRTPTVQERCAHLHREIDGIVQEAIAIQQIPAPTFEETARARYMYQQFEALQLADVQIDETGNVYARAPGREQGPALLVSAHLDTVFSAETDLTTRYTGDRLYGPGIGDNSLGVAGLLALAAQVQGHEPRRDVWFVANVGEEGLGNLRGMWAALNQLGPQLGAAIVLEGGGRSVR